MCQQFGAAWFASDEVTDSDLATARERAASTYGTPELHRHLDNQQPPRRTAEWRDWQHHQARIQTSPTPYVGEAPPAGEPGRAYAATGIARHAVGREGWSAPLAEMTVYCTLTHQDHGWRVDSIETALAGRR